MFVILEDRFFFFFFPPFPGFTTASKEQGGLEKLIAFLMCGLQQELRKGFLKENQTGFRNEPNPSVWEESGGEDEDWGGGEVQEGNKSCVWYFHIEKKKKKKRS